jgi:ribosome-associated protein
MTSGDTTKRAALAPTEVARQIVDTASDKQASDILLLDVQGVASFADFLVIMSAGSARQMVTLAEELVAALKQSGVRPHHLEGTTDSGWMLLDYFDVMVHIFSPEQRSFYGLEQVWRRGRPVVRIQ